jgi:hypothetical protein
MPPPLRADLRIGREVAALFSRFATRFHCHRYSFRCKRVANLGGEWIQPSVLGFYGIVGCFARSDRLA